MERTNPDRVDISSLSPLLLIAGVVVAAVVFAFLPKGRRLYIVLAFTVAWSMIGQMLDLPFHAVAKATFAIALLGVSLAALLHPGPRLRLSPAVLWWLILAFGSILFVLYVDNLLFAMLLRFQWIILCVTAILISRLITDRQAADAIIRAIGVGLMLGVVFAATSVYRTGTSAFHIGRFSPYGANANQVGVIFAASVPISLYMAMRARRQLTRWVSAGMAATALGMVIMTASRTSVVVAAICLVPFFFGGLRRSAAILGAVAVGAISIIPFVYTPEISAEQAATESYGMGRLDSLETGRIEILARYLDESVSKRPITGLLGQEEESILRDEDIGRHPHNAYLEMMYIGGIIYTLPMLFLAIATVVAAVRVFLARKRLPIDSLLASIIAFFVFAVYIHAMVGGNAYYPTSAWAFIHVLASSFVLSTSAWMYREARTRQKRAARRGPVLVAAVLVALAAVACSGSGTSGKTSQEAKIGDASAPGPVAQPATGDPSPRYQPKEDNRPIYDATHLDIDPSDATPEVLCAVKLNAPNEGPEVRKKARAMRAPMLMLAYNWIVDRRQDGEFDEEDKQRFGKWIDMNIKPDSRQMIAIDYEKPYFRELRRPDTPPEQLAAAVKVYREIYDFAKARRPKARWGFYGVPFRNRRMPDVWKKRVHDLGELLLKHMDVVYLSIYDLDRGDVNGRDTVMIRTYVEESLAAAGGRPVYVFARGRYVSRLEQRDSWIPEDEFRAHIGAALDARWHDGKREHVVAGVALWDGFRDQRKDKKASPDELDRLWVRQLDIIADTVRTRRNRPRPATGGGATK